MTMAVAAAAAAVRLTRAQTHDRTATRVTCIRPSSASFSCLWATATREPSSPGGTEPATRSNVCQRRSIHHFRIAALASANVRSYPLVEKKRVVAGTSNGFAGLGPSCAPDTLVTPGPRVRRQRAGSDLVGTTLP